MWGKLMSKNSMFEIQIPFVISRNAGKLALGIGSALIAFLTYYFSKQRRVYWIVVPLTPNVKNTLEQYISKPSLSLHDVMSMDKILKTNHPEIKHKGFSIRIPSANKNWFKKYKQFIDIVNLHTQYKASTLTEHEFTVPLQGIIKSENVLDFYHLLKDDTVKEEFCKNIASVTRDSDTFFNMSASMTKDIRICNTFYGKLAAATKTAKPKAGKSAGKKNVKPS
jgi:hypothetical protein